MLWPFSMINSALLDLIHCSFSFVEYDIVSGALICLPIKADGFSSLQASGIVL